MQAMLVESHQRLRRWYQAYGRHHLPWRNTDDPYHIYISEIMLQQTQVQTVLDRYYVPFLKRFPTLSSLASAPMDDVLKAWQGLGYYRRALYAHQTAQQAEPHLPDSVEALMKLPGIGKNTASAIAVFAFKQAVPIMEANVKRILHRLFALERASDTKLWELASSILDKENPFDYNQAMMDLGSMVCTVRNPACTSCPLENLCQGKSAPLAYPKLVTKKKSPVRLKNIILFTHQDSYYITARSTEFLHGYYGFCEYDKESPIEFFGKQYPLDQQLMLGTISQTYSHFKLIADIYHITLENRTSPEKWKTITEIRALPLSGADIKILTLLEKNNLKK